MSPLSLHLNGGPRDDAYVECQFPILFVRKLVTNASGFSAAALLSADAPVVAFRVVEGKYQVRRDVFGQSVPHNLAGWIEADWQGWDS